MVSGINLQSVYQEGNEINLNSGSPVVIKTSPVDVPGDPTTVALRNAGLVVSGAVPSSNFPVALTAIVPGSIHLASRFPFISASGFFSFEANGALNFVQRGGVSPIQIINLGNENGQGGEIRLLPFGGSGTLEYLPSIHSRATAGAGWYSKNNTGVAELLPTSGQIQKMIVDILKRFDLI